MNLFDWFLIFMIHEINLHEDDEIKDFTKVCSQSKWRYQWLRCLSHDHTLVRRGVFVNEQSWDFLKSQLRYKAKVECVLNWWIIFQHSYFSNLFSWLMVRTFLQWAHLNKFTAVHYILSLNVLHLISFYLRTHLIFSLRAQVDTPPLDNLAAFFHNIGLESSSAGVIYWPAQSGVKWRQYSNVVLYTVMGLQGLTLYDN